MSGPHHVHALAGGATLVTAAMPERLSASVVLMFGGGSRQGVGGFINASTDKELTAYWTRVPAEHLALGVDVLLDIVSNSNLAPADVERERMVILEELRMYQDQPQDFVQNLFEEAMWPGHPLGRDIAGTEQSVARLTRDDILEFANGRYRLPNLVIGVAGAVDEQTAPPLVSSGLILPAELDGGPSPATPPALDASRVVMRRRRTEQAHICMGVRAYSYLHPDRYVLDLLNTVLGEGMSSRLFLNIRERLGLAYDVHSFTQKHRDTGLLGVYLGVEPKKAAQAVAAVMGEMRVAREQELTDEELYRAKEFTKGRLRLELETTNGVAFWLTYQQLLMGAIKTIDEEVALVDVITAQDVRRVANDVLGGPMQLAVIGPFAKDTSFRLAIGA